MLHLFHDMPDMPPQVLLLYLSSITKYSVPILIFSFSSNIFYQIYKMYQHCLASFVSLSVVILPFIFCCRYLKPAHCISLHFALSLSHYVYSYLQIA